jgi:maltose O-acetyltransferase
MISRFLLRTVGYWSMPRKLRWVVLRTAGVRAATWNIGPCFFGGSDVEFGRGTYVNRECLFDPLAPITIGEQCAIGQRVAFITSSHRLGGRERRAGDLNGQPITVGDGCWIGAGATLLPGVTVAEGCVVAAGAVVAQDCPEPDTLYAGVPARAVRSLERQEVALGA